MKSGERASDRVRTPPPAYGVRFVSQQVQSVNRLLPWHRLGTRDCSGCQITPAGSLPQAHPIRSSGCHPTHLEMRPSSRGRANCLGTSRRFVIFSKRGPTSCSGNRQRPVPSFLRSSPRPMPCLRSRWKGCTGRGYLGLRGRLCYANTLLTQECTPSRGSGQNTKTGVFYRVF